ncbi:MAG: 2,3,4,5-tetrahydropyridine-2,6-dicarboxylate N-succinyltransferase [Candidatus Baltobacteraceae bacterium]
MDAKELEVEIDRLALDSAELAADPTAIDETLARLDRGRLRVCEPTPDGWVTHAWIKRAILLYFRRVAPIAIGPLELDALAGRALVPSYYDLMPTKRNYAEFGARCVPPGVARYGSYLGEGVILMPGFVNVGAYVDDGTMIDTWATVGSCAQIGKDVHLSGGVGIGGVLEPPQAQPVVIEDGAFVGSRCVVVEGVRVGSEAVLGAGVVLTASTPIVDVRCDPPVISRGYVAPGSVVIPGTMPKRFVGGEFAVPCALVIGERTPSTDRKTSLERALREHGVAI